MEKTLKLINERKKQGRVVIADIEGLKSYDLDAFVSQHVDGLLYDLNRLEEVTISLASKEDPRWINDIAVAAVIRKLKEKLEKYESE